MILSPADCHLVLEADPPRCSGAVLNVTISAPKSVVKATPKSPAEALEWEEAEVERLKLLLDGYVATVTEDWKAAAPGEEALGKMEWDSKGVDELLTQCLLRLDNIEAGAELRERRRALLRKIEGLQDGGVVCVREVIKIERGKAAAPPKL